jgi:hypothetical protein
MAVITGLSALGTVIPQNKVSRLSFVFCPESLARLRVVRLSRAKYCNCNCNCFCFVCFERV